MNSNVVRERISEVLKVDSINSSEGDFLATHVPFRKLSFNLMYGGKENHKSVSEDELYNELFRCDNFDDKHQLIIVEGSNGAGKSHFIRWINAKLRAEEDNNDLILLIRRSDNTLKGTIKQLLLKDEIKNIENREVIERLTKANNTIASEAFKMDIFYKFLAKIAYDIKENVNERLNNLTKQRLLELLKDSMVENRILQPDGPIERIYLKVAAEGGEKSRDVVALFDKSDFIFDVDFVDEMKDKGATRKAEKMADKLIENEDDSLPTEIADYMNSFVDDVIHECAGIEAGDFQQIFKEIRHELKKKGKGLILLIEDITAFTGINKELLNALITSHTGLNEEEGICRLTSVVGTTTEYYNQFRDNYRDRVTSEVKINDGAIGDNKQDLVEFVARYLNVMSLEKSEVDNWYLNGSCDNDYPVHEVVEGEGWDTVVISNGSEINLYPFTINAIINLYNGLDKRKTPRYILRFIVEKAVYDVLENKQFFPSFCSGYSLSRLSTTDETQIYNYISLIYKDENERNRHLSRVKYLISYWGNSSMISDEDTIGGLKLSVYNELGFEAFAKAVPKKKSSAGLENSRKEAEPVKNTSGSMPLTGNPLGRSNNNTSTLSVTPNLKETADADNRVVNDKSIGSTAEMQSIDIGQAQTLSGKEAKIPPDVLKKRSKYQPYLENIRKWLEDKNAPLIIEQKFRDDLSDFILDLINWQDEGVSYFSKQLFHESTRKIIGFEGQEVGQDNAVLICDRNMESFQLLVAFGKYYYLGNSSWDFEDSASAVYTLTCWLSKNKEAVIKAVKGETDENGIPLYIKNAIILEIYRQLLNKNYKSKIEDYTSADLMKKFTVFSAAPNGHNEKWRGLLQFIYDEKIEDVHDMIINYFKTIQGSSINSKRVILRYLELERVIDIVKKDFRHPDVSTMDIITAKRKPSLLLKSLTAKLSEAVNEEKKKAAVIYKELLTFLGLDEDDDIEKDDIKEILSDIESFYNSAINYGCNIENLRDNVEDFRKRIPLLLDSFAIVQKSIRVEDEFALLVMFSGDPIRPLELLRNFMKRVNHDVKAVNSKVETDKSNLASDGIWPEGYDPRFDDEEKSFAQLYESMKS